MFEPIGETKVGDYHVPMPVEEEVFEFEVAMNDFFLVNVPDARDELTEEFARILLLQVTVGKDVVEEFATRRVFEDDTDVLVGFDDVVESDDVRVFESLKEGVDANRRKGFSGAEQRGEMTKWTATDPEDLDFTFDLGHASRSVDVSSSDQLYGDFFSPLHMEP